MNELMHSKWADRRMINDFDRFLRHMFSPFTDFSPELMNNNSGLGSRMEVETGEKEVKASLPIPGFRKEEINVEVTGDQLTITAEHTCCPQEHKGRFMRRERSWASFTESVRLPVPVKGTEAQAVYRDGVLTVTLPRETVQNGHRIVAVNG